MALPNTLCPNAFLLQILLGTAFLDHAVAFNPLPHELGMELLMSIKHVNKLLNAIRASLYLFCGVNAKQYCISILTIERIKEGFCSRLGFQCSNKVIRWHHGFL